MQMKIFSIASLFFVTIQTALTLPDAIPTRDAPIHPVHFNKTPSALSAFQLHKRSLSKIIQFNSGNSSFDLKNIEFGTTGAKRIRLTLNGLDERVSGSQILVMIKPLQVKETSFLRTISKVVVPKINKIKELVLEAEVEPHHGVHDLHFSLPHNVHHSQVSSISFTAAGPTPGQWYMISARLNGKVVEVAGVETVEGPVDMWTFFYGDNQIFSFEEVSTDLYKIVVKRSQLVLEAAGMSAFDNVPIQSASYKGTDNQHWLVEAIEDGMFKIINRNSYKCFDIYGGYIDNGTPVHQNGYWGGENQKFFLIPIC